MTDLLTTEKLFPDGLVDAVLSRQAARDPGREAVADPRQRLSYGELASRVQRTSALFRRLGLRRGGRVNLLMKNSVSQIVAHFAVLHAGGVSVPLPPTMRGERLSHCYRQTEPDLVVIDSPLESIARAVMGEEAGARLITERESEGAVAASLADAEREPDGDEVAGRDATDLACLMYTTGSTGLPKAVILSHETLANSLRNIVQFVGYDGASREAVVLPLSHSFGLGHVYCNLATGGFVWVDDGMKRLKRLMDALTGFRIDGLPCTPSMLNILMGKFRPYFVQHAQGLRFMVVNSAPLPAAMTAELRAALPRLRILVYYGLTEASRSTFIDLSRDGPERYASVGPAAPNVEIGVFDMEGRRVLDDVEGEVRIAGDHLGLGYWRGAEETAAAFVDGWLRTGDLGFLDDQGYLTLTGRADDQINVGGLKVLPAEVERVLTGYPQVSDAAVAEVTDPLGIVDSAIGALVVPAEGGIEVDDLRAFCTDRLERFMVPSVIRIVSAVPRAESGKILREEVRRRLREDSGESARGAGA